ncbi:hypothetical protein BDR22DRAFT_887507 [Usnea florida]
MLPSSSIVNRKGLSIHPRNSDTATIQKHQPRLTGSQPELKRKLSETSFDQASIQYRKSMIEEMNLRQEEMVQKSLFDMEYDQRRIKNTEHPTRHKEANKKSMSLGDDLWTEQEEMKKQEEREGRVQKLEPDPRSAFITTLLALYNKPQSSKKRSSKVQSHMRSQSITKYGARKGALTKDPLWCCITQRYWPQEEVRAAHLVPQSLGPELAEYVFGSGSGLRMDTSDNCLLMHISAERSFDNGNFVLLPVDANETPILRCKIQLTNTAAVNSPVGGETLKDLDGKPFATMRPYMRESMLVSLARMAGDLNATEEAKFLGGEGAMSVEEQKLADVEETEVARRALEGHEVEDEEDEDEEEEDEDQSSEGEAP